MSKIMRKRRVVFHAPAAPRPRVMALAETWSGAGPSSLKPALVVLGAGLFGAGGAYLLSWLLSAASCETGTCPIASVSWPLVALFGAVSAVAAAKGMR